MTKRFHLRITLSILLAIYGVGASHLNAKPAPSPLVGVEQLPVDRFDEYLAGSLPPFPWKPVGKFSNGVNLSLQEKAESPFIGNRVTGKGLVMTDNDPKAGEGCGIEYSFAPPPPHQLYLGFDFQVAEGAPLGQRVNLECELTDASGQGLKLRLGEADQLQAGSSKGQAKTIAPLEPGQWYHLTVDFPSSNRAVVSVSDFANQQHPITSCTIELGKKALLYRHLRFLNSGGEERTGAWSLDNILMAGQVDSPRTAWWPFRQAPLKELRGAQRKVYAYYYEIYTSGYSDQDPGLTAYTRRLFNPTLTAEDRVKAGTELLYRPLPRPRMAAGLSKEEVLIRAMEEEVRLAIQMGLDGFLLDFFALPDTYADADNIRTYNQRSFALMEAAQRVDPQFKIIPAIYAGPTPVNDPEIANKLADDYADSPIVEKALKHPQALRLEDGRVILSKWGTERYTAAWWERAVNRLNAKDTPTAFIGQFNGCSAQQLSPYSPVCYGMADWGPRSPIDYHWATTARPLTSLVISPVALQDVRTRERCYWESCNSDALRKMWQAAITDKPDWVFITTWSDYTEQAQAPSTAIGFAPYDLNAYYLQWFKLGTQPEITKDVLYYFYRRHHTEIDPGRGEKWRLIKDKNGSDTRNEIELLAFLKEPGELIIQTGATSQTMQAAAGINSFKVPLPAGKSFTPIFTLRRNEKTILSGHGRYTILDKIEFPNLLYHAGVVTPDGQ